MLIYCLTCFWLIHFNFGFDYCSENVVVHVDADDHVPSSRSFDTSVRPDILSLESSIPEETAVEIADTSYAPVASPNEPPERTIASAGVETSPEDLDGQNLDRVSTTAPVKSELFAVDNDLLPNGKGEQLASSAGNKPTTLSRFWSVFAAVIAVLICTLVGAIVMFEFDGTVPFAASLHSLPGVNHFHRKIYRPLQTASRRSLPS